MEISATPFRPWVDVWTKPRAVIGWLARNDPKRNVMLLAALGGISQALDRASRESSGDEATLVSVLLLAVVAGPIGGIISMYVVSWLVGLTGDFVGGKATNKQIRTAYAWANVPLVAALFLVAVQVALLGNEVFSTATPQMSANPLLAVSFFGLALLEVALGIWAFVLYLKGLGEVQGFSAWKALGNVILSVLVVFVPALLLAGAVALLS